MNTFSLEDEIRRIVKEQVETPKPAVTQGIDLLSGQEAVQFLGDKISYSTLMREASQGRIPCIKVGRRVFFTTEMLSNWIHSLEVGV